MTRALRHVGSAIEGLAYEQALFAESGSHVGLWRATSNGLVCPEAYSRRETFEVAEARARRAEWPVALRGTGGGTVPQGHGIDNLVLAFDMWPGGTIEDGYRLLTRIIKRGLGTFGASLAPGETPGSFCDGAWNLSLDGRKIVGTAQRWKPARGGPPRVLAHAVILTLDSYDDGAKAVAAFHEDLGLSAINSKAHTSLEAAFGLTELPVADLIASAQDELDLFPRSLAKEL
ncbi:MAG: hypothetical protein AAGD04_10635 [Pseudomonadota bacterium]